MRVESGSLVWYELVINHAHLEEQLYELHTIALSLNCFALFNDHVIFLMHILGVYVITLISNERISICIRETLRPRVMFDNNGEVNQSLSVRCARENTGLTPTST